MPNYVSVLLNALFSFIGLFIISKFLGKKQISELSFTDYVVGISIGSIAAEWSTDVVNPWYYYAIAMAIYFLLSYAITHLARTTLFFKSFLRGKPLLIIKDGKVDYKSLKKSKLDVNDLAGLCRDKGFFNMTDVAFAIYETNGTLSVLPVSAQKPTVVDDFGISLPQSNLTKFLISDGTVDSNYLKTLKKDEKWLFDKLNIQNKKDLKNILIAFYDEQKDSFDIHYKKISNKKSN